MNKILFITLSTLLGIFLYNTARAEQVLCPQSVACNYEKGTCDTHSGWLLEDVGASEPFSGDLTIQFSKAMAYKMDKYYQLDCYYSYGKYSNIMLSGIADYLTGSKWQFSGFGKKKAECSDVTFPEECSAEINE